MTCLVSPGRKDTSWDLLFMFPKKLYFAIANKSRDLNAKAHGLRPEDLYRRL